jgi:hypothetical protein
MQTIVSISMTFNFSPLQKDTTHKIYKALTVHKHFCMTLSCCFTALGLIFFPYKVRWLASFESYDSGINFPLNGVALGWVNFREESCKKLKKGFNINKLRG